MNFGTHSLSATARRLCLGYGGRCNGGSRRGGCNDERPPKTIVVARMSPHLVSRFFKEQNDTAGIPDREHAFGLPWRQDAAICLWPDSVGRIGDTGAVHLEQQRNRCPLSTRVERNEPHVPLCHPPDRRRFLSALSDLHQVQNSTE